MMIKINKMKGRKGFTLVELLLVVAILAVLAFLAVPAIAETIRNSRMRTCESNEKMVEDSIWRWYADQVAAGKTLATGAVNLTAASTLAQVQALITGADSLPAYFTPGGVPKCPFASAVVEPYGVLVSIHGGGFLDVVTVCSQAATTVGGTNGHPIIAVPRTLKTTP